MAHGSARSRKFFARATIILLMKGYINNMTELDKLIREQAKDDKSRRVQHDPFNSHGTAKISPCDPLIIDSMECKVDNDLPFIPTAKPDIHKRAAKYTE